MSILARPDGVDYMASSKKGGSEKGKSQRFWPLHIKLAVWRFAYKEIAHGNEQIFWDRPGPGPGRWTVRNFIPVARWVIETFPEEVQAQVGEDWDVPERVAFLLHNRHHRMYYHNDGKRRVRVKACTSDRPEPHAAMVIGHFVHVSDGSTCARLPYCLDHAQKVHHLHIVIYGGRPLSCIHYDGTMLDSWEEL